MRIKLLIFLFLILALTFFSFSPSLNNKFTNFDDPTYVVSNPLIRSISPKNIFLIFNPFIYTEFYPPQLYVPLVTLSYAFEYHFFGLNPSIYHLDNLILHLLNCLLVFWLMFLITNNLFQAFMISILFGIHPLRVESVAWVTERKDVLCGAFFLSTIISYVYYIESNRRRNYYIAILLFVLALLSKPLAITLPFILLLCDYLFKQKITIRNILNKLPLFVVGYAFLMMGELTTKKYLHPDPAFSVFDHFCIAGYVPIFYLNKTVLPVGLSCLYPYPLKNNGFLPPIFLFSLFMTIGLIFLVALFKRYSKKILFGGIFFLITIPFLQFLPTGPTIVADRYSYISSIGFLLLASELAILFYQRKIRGNRVAVLAATFIFIVIITVLSSMAWQRSKVWQNEFTLWDDAVKKYPREYIPVAYFNRGVAYLNRGKYKSAISDFDRALMLYYKRLKIKQNYVVAYNELLNSEYGYPAVCNFLGAKYADISMLQESIILFQSAIRINPSFIDAYVNLSAAYGDSGRYKEAINAGKAAIAINHNSAAAHYNLSVAYFFDNQRNLALEHLRRATELGFKPEAEFLKAIKTAPGS